jgi:alkane 1-monooxygenase
MKNLAIKNAGYLLVFCPQILLVVSANARLTWIPFVFFFILLPIMRYIVGDDLSPSNKSPSKLLLIYLNAIPRLYCAVWATILPWTIWFIAVHPMSVFQYIGFSLSLWIVTSINTAVAHEMIHEQNSLDRFLGNLLDSSVGYVHFSEAHLNHHATNGHYFDSDAATPGTSIYRYTCNRYLISLSVAWEYEKKRLKHIHASWFDNRLLRKALIPVGIATAFYAFGGITGLVIYLFQIAGAIFTVQAITYLQHWGLSEMKTPAMADFGFSWDDGCWLQACLTLNIAFHGQHHLKISRRYYELELVKGGLRLPAGYPIMFMIALFPSFFTKSMAKRLAIWTEQREKGGMIKDKITCMGNII